MKSTSMLILASIVLASGCGPKQGAGTTPEKGAAATEGAETHGAGEVGTVEFMGVRYSVSAEPFKGAGGWGVGVKVVAEAVDSKDHAFVNDKLEAEGEPTALRFDTAHMSLETLSPGSPVELTRDFPDPGKMGLVPGEGLGLTVGVWGIEDAEGGQRFSPNLAHISMTIMDSGDPTFTVTMLDPGEDPPPDFISYDIGTHQLVIKPFYPYKQKVVTKSGENVTVYEVGDTIVRIKGDEIVVGDKHYGTLPKGEPVLVDHGKVIVASEEREGKEIIRPKLLEFYANPVSEHKVGDYKVVVSPGAEKFGVMSSGETYTLILDDKELKFEEEKLYINGVSYGKIKKKATVEIYFGDISIGDKKIEPEKTGEDAK